MSEASSGRVSGVVLTDEDAALVVGLVDQLRVLGRRNGFGVNRRILNLRRLCVPVVSETNTQTDDMDWLIQSSQDLTDFVDVKSAAEALGCTSQNIRYLIGVGRLDAQKVGGRWAVDSESIRHYIESRH